jgi:hypothetical protein
VFRVICISICMFVSVCHTSVAVEPAPQTPIVESQDAALEPAKIIRRLERGEKVTIVTMGTSLAGGTWRWVDVMKAWLDKDYPNLVALHNLGEGASASETVPLIKGNKWAWQRCGLDRAREAAALRPDIVFILNAEERAWRSDWTSSER